MNRYRTFLLLILINCLSATGLGHSAVHGEMDRFSEFMSRTVNVHPLIDRSSQSAFSFDDWAERGPAWISVKASRADFGIKEIVPSIYRERYELWKKGLVETEFGHSLWKKYSENRSFLLTIRVEKNRKFGAGTGAFEWDRNGKLIAATIYLGHEIDRGFPDPIYYPVMNSLGPSDFLPNGERGALASAKLVHELGHVEHTANMDGVLYQKQDELIDQYYKIFLGNGYDSSDPKLVEITQKLGAQPIEIWEDREYWSEVSSLRYINERLFGAAAYCGVVRQLALNLENFPLQYRQRFDLFRRNISEKECR